VELGRLDGKVGTRAVVKHNLPGAGFDLDQLNKLFAANGLTQTDMIALSGTRHATAISALFLGSRCHGSRRHLRPIPAAFVARRRRACPFQAGGRWACPASSHCGVQAFSLGMVPLGWFIHGVGQSMSIAGWLALRARSGCQPVARP
jgi:hypothetical protein